MSMYDETALERALSYSRPDHSVANLRAAAREMIGERRRYRTSIAQDLRAKRAAMARLMHEHGVPLNAPFRAVMLRKMREHATRHAPRRATLLGLRCELASLQRAAHYRMSAEYAARMNALPCGLQDSEDFRRAEDEAMARILPYAIRILERESK